MSNNRAYLAVFEELQGDWRAWLEWVEEISRALSLPFTHYGSSRPDAPATPGIRPFSHRGAVRVASAPVRSMEIYSLPERYRQPVFDWLVLAKRHQRKSSVDDEFLGWVADTVEWEQMSHLLSGLLQFIRPDYGFGGCTHRHKAPALYAVGLATSAQSEREQREARRWSDDLRGPQRFRTGLLLSVFPVNILTQPHLTQRFGSVDLRTAIDSGELPGRLVSVDDRCTAWLVDPDDTFDARWLLGEEGLLL